MKPNTSLLILLPAILLALTTPASAQTTPSARTIFDDFQSPSPGKGKVIIDQPTAIRNLVGSRIEGEIRTTADGKSYIHYQGFRIQVYSGNDHRTSKDEAFKREKELKDLLPDLPTYVNFEAPFWRLRVGDFSTREEAYDTQLNLMQLLPGYKKEMYIVKEDIKIPLNEGN